MFRRAFASFHPSAQPWITRQSYRYELAHALTFPFALTLVEGSVVGVLAQKAFAVGPLLFAAIMASPMFANVTSFIWAHLARGRGKVRFINVLQVAVLLCIASIALLPTAGVGPVLLTALIILSRCLLAGIVTTRSTIWRMNYPRAVRGRVTGRLVIINSLLMAIVPAIGYTLLDVNPNAFRIVYPAAVVVSLLGVWSFSKVRLRGERELLKYEAAPSARPQPHGETGSIYEYAPDAETTTAWQVLRRDRLFRGYMIGQFILGFGSMSAEVVVIYMIAKMTSGMSLEYLVSILLSTVIPMLITTLTLPLWAKMFDGMHVIRFRISGGWLWMVAQLCYFMGAMTGTLIWLVVARFVVGVARSAGMLAWNLGHNDFASRRMVAVYMGIHVTLTGVRGAIAPFMGMLLYVGWSQSPVGSLPAIGAGVFLVSVILTAVSQIIFWRLIRLIPASDPSRL
jgi:MFS family permease